MNLVYYVFEGELAELDGTPTGEKFKFCCSNVRWHTLKEEIKKEWLLMVQSGVSM